MSDNYWKLKFNCTRSQARRIMQDAPHYEALDGPWPVYRERCIAIRDCDNPTHHLKALSHKAQITRV